MSPESARNRGALESTRPSSPIISWGRQFLMDVVVDEPSVPMTLIQDWMGTLPQ